MAGRSTLVDPNILKRDPSVLFRLLRHAGPAVCALVLITLSHASSPNGPNEAREAAVAVARSGNLKSALASLTTLLEHYPEDPRLLADSTIVANWAGDDALALELYSCSHTPKDDIGVVEAAARAARNLHRFDIALELYRHAVNISPSRWQAQLGQALVLTDEGKTDAAAALMKVLVEEHGSDSEVLQGNAYLCGRQKKFACVLAMSERLRKLGIRNEEGTCQTAQALSDVGAELSALEACSNPDSEIGRRLLAAAGAEELRSSEVYNLSRDRLTHSSHALEKLDQAIALSSKTDAIWQQAQNDRLQALFELNRHRNVVTTYQQLKEQNLSLPPYALRVVANAYLVLREPDSAERLYRDLLRNSPKDGELWGALAYAQFEQEHIQQAFHSIDQAYANAPAWMTAPGLKEPQPNTLHLALGLQAAVMRGYAGLFPEEQSRLTALLASAPANIEARRRLALTYLARGWPKRAMTEERIADSYAQPDERSAVLETAEIEEAAGRRDDVDAVIPKLLERDGRTPAILKFLREKNIARGWQLDTTGNLAWSSGGYIGTSDQHNEAHLYSPFIRNRWRIFGRALYDRGEFSQGNAIRERFGLGISYAYERQSIWGEVARDAGTAGHRIAGSLGANLNFGDHWALHAQGESNNVSDVQLIAALGGVRARSGDLALSWHANELRQAHLGAQALWFTDGNQRLVLWGAWDEKIFRAPHVQLNISPQFWTSLNSMDENRPYFNPKQDVSLGPLVTMDWITWRHYERTFHQTISGYVAPRWQRDYGTGPAGSASYVQQWKLSDRVGIHCGVTWNTQPYDGRNESYMALRYGVSFGNQ